MDLGDGSTLRAAGARTSRSALLAAGALAAVLAGAAPAVAADAVYSAGFHLAGLRSLSPGARSARVYSADAPALGADLEIELGERARLDVEFERAAFEGHEALAFNPPLVSGTKRRLDRFTFAWEWEPAAGGRWRPLLRIGPTALAVAEDDAVSERERFTLGGSVGVGLRHRAAGWATGVWLLYTRVPGAFEDRRGTAQVFAHEDWQSVELALEVRRRPAPARERPEEGDGKRPRRHEGERRREVFLALGALTPTHVHRRDINNVTILSTDADTSPALAVGLELPLAGPLAVAVDLFAARPRLHSRLTPYGDRSAGTVRLTGGSVALVVPLAAGRRWRLTASPLVDAVRYRGATREGDFETTVDRAGCSFGGALAGEVRSGRWRTRLELRHLALARLRGYSSGFDLKPWTLSLGVGYAF